MRFLWPAVYIGYFLVVDVFGGMVAGVSGLGVAITKAVLTGQYVTSYRAYSTLATVNGVVGLAFATVVILAIWSIRHPGALRARFRAVTQRVKAPSGIDLVVIWVVAVVTVVGYLVAIYATWRYATGHRAGAVGDESDGAPPAAGTKLCPDCAETVLAAARVCRFCRHEFPAVPIVAPASGALLETPAPDEMPIPAPEPEPLALTTSTPATAGSAAVPPVRNGRGVWAPVGVLALIVGLVLLGVAGFGLSNATPASTEAPTSAPAANGPTLEPYKFCCTVEDLTKEQLNWCEGHTMWPHNEVLQEARRQSLTLPGNIDARDRALQDPASWPSRIPEVSASNLAQWRQTANYATACFAAFQAGPAPTPAPTETPYGTDRTTFANWASSDVSAFLEAVRAIDVTGKASKTATDIRAALKLVAVNLSWMDTHPPQLCYVNMWSHLHASLLDHQKSLDFLLKSVLDPNDATSLHDATLLLEQANLYFGLANAALMTTSRACTPP